MAHQRRFADKILPFEVLCLDPMRAADIARFLDSQQWTCVGKWSNQRRGQSLNMVTTWREATFKTLAIELIVLNLSCMSVISGFL